MARVHPETSTVRMEDILEETGWGLYYRVLIGITAASSFCQSIATLSITFALPLSTCDSFIIEESILNVILCFYVGKAIGGLFLSALSDTIGRLSLIPNSLMIIFGSAFLAAFAHSPPVLHVAAVLLGSGIEANRSITKIHLAEILPKNKRGYYLTLPDIFWTLGVLSMTGFAWKLSEHSIVEHISSDMRMTAWRLIFAVAGGFSIFAACASALAQPSPRFLLYKNEISAANTSMKKFYAINKSKYSESWPHQDEDVSNLINDFQINAEPDPINYIDSVFITFRKMIKTTRLLFMKRFIKTTFFFNFGQSVSLHRHYTYSHFFGQSTHLPEHQLKLPERKGHALSLSTDQQHL